MSPPAYVALYVGIFLATVLLGVRLWRRGEKAEAAFILAVGLNCFAYAAFFGVGLWTAQK